MAYAGDLSLLELTGERPDLVVISPNDPQAMRRYVPECQQLGIPYIYDPSQQIPRLNDEDLHSGLDGALALFVNLYELCMIQNRTQLSFEAILSRTKFAVVTHGEQGSIVYQAGQEYPIPVVPPERIVDPTGVGDAFRGGFRLAIYMALISNHAAGWAPWRQLIAWSNKGRRATPSRQVNLSPVTVFTSTIGVSWINSCTCMPGWRERHSDQGAGFGR